MGGGQVRLGQDVLGVLQENTACLGEHGALPAGLKELHTELPFQLAHRNAEARLGDMDGFRRLAEAAQLRGGTEIADLIEGHGAFPLQKL